MHIEAAVLLAVSSRYCTRNREGRSGPASSLQRTGFVPSQLTDELPQRLEADHQSTNWVAFSTRDATLRSRAQACSVCRTYCHQCRTSGPDSALAEIEQT